MSVSSGLVRSTHRNVTKLPSTLRGALLPRHFTQIPSRTLATVNPGQKALPDVWFTGSRPDLDIEPTKDGGPPKPDERTLKLGKSKQAYLFPSILLSNSRYSITSLTRTSTYSSPITSATRNPLSPNNTPPLSLHPSPPPHRIRSTRLFSSSMDLTYNMGPRPHRWQREA